MAKAIRDGKVAILYSPNYGAGWSTWYYGEDKEVKDFLLHDEKLVEMVENKVDSSVIESYVESVYPEVYTGGADTLTVEWVKEGTQFRIDEYDGSESLIINNDNYWLVA